MEVTPQEATVGMAEEPIDHKMPGDVGELQSDILANSLQICDRLLTDAEEEANRVTFSKIVWTAVSSKGAGPYIVPKHRVTETDGKKKEAKKPRNPGANAHGLKFYSAVFDHFIDPVEEALSGISSWKGTPTAYRWGFTSSMHTGTVTTVIAIHPSTVGFA